jgi:hypothetical protein
MMKKIFQISKQTRKLNSLYILWVTLCDVTNQTNLYKSLLALLPHGNNQTQHSQRNLIMSSECNQTKSVIIHSTTVYTVI